MSVSNLIRPALLIGLALVAAIPAIAQTRDYNLAPEIRVKPRKQFEFAPKVKQVEVIRRREVTVTAPEAWRDIEGWDDKEGQEIQIQSASEAKKHARLMVENLRCVSGGTVGRCLDRKGMTAGIIDDGWEITALGSGTMLVKRTIMFAKNLPIQYSWRVLENGQIEPASSRAKMITVDVEDDDYRLDELDSIYDAGSGIGLR